MPRTSNKAQMIVDYVNQFIQENGYSPSVREIGAAVGLRSTASVSYHLQALQAKGLLRGVNLLQQDFSPELPLTPLHWMAADRTGAAIVVEPMEEGLRIVDAPAGVLTNAPPFDWQMTDLSRYMALSSAQPENRFAPGLELPAFSRGMGAMGLPGDLSSTSRFVRAAFFRHNSPTPGTPEEGVSQMFHILNTVAQPRGGVVLPGGGEVRTVYAACCDLGRGIYFWRSYENSRLTAAALEEMDLEGKALVTWPLSREQDILWKRAE